MASIGSLTKTVAFQTNTPVAQGVGKKDVYATVLTRRGSLTKKSGNRSLQFGEKALEVSHDLHVRYEAALNAILTTRLKILIDSRVFAVQDWEIIDDQNQWIKFRLNELKD